jgi:hypothetical protein
MIIPAVQNPHWEACGLHERMLHRMQLAVARKAFDRRQPHGRRRERPG